MMEARLEVTRRRVRLMFVLLLCCSFLRQTEAWVRIEDNETAVVLANNLVDRLACVDPNSWDIERFEDALVASVESFADINAACVFLDDTAKGTTTAACGVRGGIDDGKVELADISGPPPAWYNATLAAFLKGTYPQTGGAWLDTQHDGGEANVSTMTYTRPVTTSFSIESNRTFNMSGGDIQWWGAVAVSYFAASHVVTPPSILVSCPAGESAEVTEVDDGFGVSRQCVECPFPARCLGTSSGQRNCSEGTWGPLCLELDGEHFAFGVSVLECPAWPYQTVIGCSISAMVLLLAAGYARRGKLLALYMKYQVNFRIWINFTQLVVAHLPLLVLPSDTDLLAHGAQGINSVAPFTLSGIRCMVGQFSWSNKFFWVTGAFFLVHASLLAIDRYHARNLRDLKRAGSSIREEERSIAARALTRQMWVLMAQLLLSYWINATMESITCVNVGSNDVRLFYESSLECFGTTHIFMLCWGGTVALCFFGLVGAVTYALVDVKEKHGYYKARNRKQLGALYTSYTQRFMLFGMASYWRRIISLALCRHDYQAGLLSSWWDSAVTVVYFFYVHLNSPCIGHYVAVPLLSGRRTFDLYNSLEKITTAAVFAIQFLICVQVSGWWQPTSASFVVVLALIAMSSVAIWSPWRALDDILQGRPASTTAAPSSPVNSSPNQNAMFLLCKRLTRYGVASVDKIRHVKVYKAGSVRDTAAADTNGMPRRKQAPLVRGKTVPSRIQRHENRGSFSDKALSLHKQLMAQREKFVVACESGRYDLAKEVRENVLRLNGTITEDLERREQRALKELDTDEAVEVHELRSDLMITDARHAELKTIKTQLEQRLQREEQDSVDAFARLDIRCFKMYLGRFHTELVNHADLFRALKHRHDVDFDLATQQLLHAIYSRDLDEAMVVESRTQELMQAYTIDLRAQQSWAVDALSSDDLPPISVELEATISCMRRRFGIRMASMDPTSVRAGKLSNRKLSMRKASVIGRIQRRVSSRSRQSDPETALRNEKRGAFEDRWEKMLMGFQSELMPKINENYTAAVECAVSVMSGWKSVVGTDGSHKSTRSLQRALLDSVPRNLLRSAKRDANNGEEGNGARRRDRNAVRLERLMRNAEIGTHMDYLEHFGDKLMVQSTQLLTEMIADGFLRETVQLWGQLESTLASSWTSSTTSHRRSRFYRRTNGSSSAGRSNIPKAKDAITGPNPNRAIAELEDGRQPQTGGAKGNAVQLVTHLPTLRQQKIDFLFTRNRIEQLLREDDDPWRAHELNDANKEQFGHMMRVWEHEAHSIILSGQVCPVAAHKLLLYAQCIKQRRCHWNPHKSWRPNSRRGDDGSSSGGIAGTLVRALSHK